MSIGFFLKLISKCRYIYDQQGGSWQCSGNSLHTKNKKESYISSRKTPFRYQKSTCTDSVDRLHSTPSIQLKHCDPQNLIRSKLDISCMSKPQKPINSYKGQGKYRVVGDRELFAECQLFLTGSLPFHFQSKIKVRKCRAII